MLNMLLKVCYLKPTLNPTLETPISTWDPVGHDPVPIHTCVHTCAPCVNRQDPMLPRAELGLFPCQSTKDEPNSTTPTPRTQFFDPNPLRKGPAQQDPRYSRNVELLRPIEDPTLTEAQIAAKGLKNAPIMPDPPTSPTLPYPLVPRAPPAPYLRPPISLNLPKIPIASHRLLPP